MEKWEIPYSFFERFMLHLKISRVVLARFKRRKMVERVICKCKKTVASN